MINFYGDTRWALKCLFYLRSNVSKLFLKYLINIIGQKNTSYFFLAVSYHNLQNTFLQHLVLK